ncbi:MAG: hotdog domain-containing protein, partial [Oscillospiraceae bacterium]
MSITVGLTGSAETVVTDQNTAAALGSGSLPVFATPAMVALMETAAVAALEGHLEAGESSVGTRLEISHDAASPVGISVRAEAEVVAITGKAISFTVRC